MSRILLVEDEENIREGIKLNLELDKFEVVATGDGKSALQLFRSQHFDLIILDVMLPEIDGFQICEQIRLENLDVPIMFLTAKDTSVDKVHGLKKGADDYLVKPFVLEELLLRIHNLLKRTQKSTGVTTEVVNFGENEVNFKTYNAQTTRGEVQLTKKEAMLLKLLIDRKNDPFIPKIF